MALSLACALIADLAVCFANESGEGFIGIQDPHWYGAFSVAAVTLAAATAISSLTTLLYLSFSKLIIRKRIQSN